MYNEYDPYGGHTKEEADAAYEDLFKELHGEGELGDTKKPSSVYVIASSDQTIDSVCATVCFAHLLNMLNPGDNNVPCITSPMSLEISFVLAYFEKLLRNKNEDSVEKVKPIHIEMLNEANYDSNASIVLIGHNKPKVKLTNFNQEKITEIIDCHNLEGMETKQAVKVTILPFGSVSTIVSHIYREHFSTPNPYIAGLLCAGIISATRNFKSENTNQADRLEAVLLANSAGIDIQDFYNKIVQSD